MNDLRSKTLCALVVRLVFVLPGLVAFYFVDVAQLAMLHDQVDLAVVAERCEQSIDPFDLVNRELLQVESRNGTFSATAVHTGHRHPSRVRCLVCRARASPHPGTAPDAD